MTEPKKTELIVALDVSSYNEAVDLVTDLARMQEPRVTWFKVGLELFIADGDRIVRTLKNIDHKIMLDLKLHDIPETVARATKKAVERGVDMLTVHAAGGPEMMEAAVKGANNKATILAVTVLTSLDEERLRQLGINMTPREWAFRLANFASLSGVPGLVCSAHEAAELHDFFPSMLLVTPGIRPTGSVVGDQKRVATPADARAACADFIVVGRPIRDAPDRAAAAKAIMAELTG